MEYGKTHKQIIKWHDLEPFLNYYDNWFDRFIILSALLHKIRKFRTLLE